MSRTAAKAGPTSGVAGCELPHRVLAFYGDDFTGSSAVMEVMTFAGLPTVMFLEPPDAARLKQFESFRGIGIAGTARAESPAWMEAHLPAAFEALRSYDAAINHYKVCSTFDSSPEIGSIGLAIDLAFDVFRPRFAPLIVGAPAIRRYQAFGHLFAAFEGLTYRLDRHPSMSRHPATPMHESDIARHLSRQTARRIELVDLVTLKGGRGGAAVDEAVESGASILSFDVVDQESLERVGEILWHEAAHGPILAAGSQGLEYALIAHWLAAGLIEPPGTVSPPAGAERIVVASGSVSPTTAAQIAHALHEGFDLVPVDVVELGRHGRQSPSIAAILSEARSVLAAGRSPLIATARGPDDPMVEAFRSHFPAGERAKAQIRLSEALGHVVARLVREDGMGRAVISGGDTSSYATRELGVYAMSALAPLAPGAPLCTAFSDAGVAIELALKGGQMGEVDYFCRARDGRPDGTANLPQH